MFNSLTGTLTAKYPQTLFLDTNGIEWDISVPECSLNKFSSVGTTIKVYTYLYVREDIRKVFGFYSAQERQAFLDLLKVDGVGPKGALKILSNVDFNDLATILDDEDISKLEKLPGVGKKTAQKMMLTLKGKLSLSLDSDKRTVKVSEWEDVINALMNMGYERRRCEEVVNKLESEIDISLIRSVREEQLFRRAIVELAL